MKKTILLFFLVLIISCNTQEELPYTDDTQTESIAAVVQMRSNYRLSTYDRLIDPTKDRDFVNSDVKSAMERSNVYKNRFAPITKVCAPKANTGTALESEEIPFIADITESTNIYDDGTSSFEKVIELDYEENPLLGFHTTPFDISHCVARVTVNNGKATTYNADGQQLHQMDINMPDYTEYLAELRRLQAEANTKATGAKDIQWLKERMRTINAPTKAGDLLTYEIYSTPSGTIVLEQFFGSTKGQAPGSSIKTFYSPDLTKNLGFEQYSNGSLTLRCTNSFDNSNVITKSNYSNDGIAEELPSRTVTESISSFQDGTPVIKVEEKEFHSNMVIVNL